MTKIPRSEVWRAEVERLKAENAELKDDNARLREAIKAWSKLAKLHHAVMTERERDDCHQAAMYLHQIAREGR